MKTLNSYARELKLYGSMPKAVLAAIAVSLATCGGDRLDEANERVCAEWEILAQNGIVPQKPGRLALEYAAKAKALDAE